MKANQLRIGNLVRKEYFEQGKKTYEDIHSVSGYDLSELEVNGYIEHDDERLEPIPLTEGWLKDFGFYETEEGCGFHAPAFNKNLREDTGDMLTLRPCYKDGYYWGFRESVEDGTFEIGSPRPIVYVHDLMNFWYFLTGEELTKK